MLTVWDSSQVWGSGTHLASVDTAGTYREKQWQCQSLSRYPFASWPPGLSLTRAQEREENRPMRVSSRMGRQPEQDMAGPEAERGLYHHLARLDSGTSDFMGHICEHLRLSLLLATARATEQVCRVG